MPKKPKRVVKPRRTKAWLRRSQAAKKGWETRRKRDLPKKIKRARVIIDNSRKALGKKPNPRIELSKSGKKLAAQYKKALAENKRLKKEIRFTKFVDILKPEFLHSDHTIALEPSRLRHRNETPKLRELLVKANKKGKDVLRILASRMADVYDIPIREVYTLFFSP